jgi:hypothetical protein
MLREQYYLSFVEELMKGRLSMIRPAFIALALLAGPAVAAAQDAVPPTGTDKQAETGQPPKRVRSVTLTRGEKCPTSTETDIVVCNTIEDPYRIPKALRDSGPVPGPRQAWTNRVAADEQTSRSAAGFPGTCSPVGSGGQSGCSATAARAWAAERRARANGQDPDQQ